MIPLNNMTDAACNSTTQTIVIFVDRVNNRLTGEGLDFGNMAAVAATSVEPPPPPPVKDAIDPPEPPGLPRPARNLGPVPLVRVRAFNRRPRVFPRPYYARVARNTLGT